MTTGGPTSPPMASTAMRTLLGMNSPGTPADTVGIRPTCRQIGRRTIACPPPDTTLDGGYQDRFCGGFAGVSSVFCSFKADSPANGWSSGAGGALTGSKTAPAFRG